MAFAPWRSDTRYDCVIIGAGVVGAAVAQRLARSDAKVAVVEKASGIGGGCSYANAALMAPHHVTPLVTPALLRETPRQMLSRPPAVRIRPRRHLIRWLAKLAASAYSNEARTVGSELRQLALDSAELHIELAKAGKNPSLAKTGALDIYLHDPRRTPANFLSPDEVYAIEPTLAPVAGATHESEEWTVESRSFISAMLQDATEHGAEVLFETPVERVLVEDGRAVGVKTPRGNLWANHVVLAAGLGSTGLAAKAGLTLPLRGGRGHVIDLALTADAPSLPVRIKEHRVVVTPLADRTRVSGAIEFGTEPRPGDYRRAEALRHVAARALPALRDAEVIDRWSGERPCAPDGVPVIGTSTQVGNLSVAGGHGMWGLVLAPVTARLITEGITDSPSASVPVWLSPDRFATVRPRATDHVDARY